MIRCGVTRLSWAPFVKARKYSRCGEFGRVAKRVVGARLALARQGVAGKLFKMRLCKSGQVMERQGPAR